MPVAIPARIVNRFTADDQEAIRGGRVGRSRRGRGRGTTPPSNTGTPPAANAQQAGGNATPPDNAQTQPQQSQDATPTPTPANTANTANNGASSQNNDNSADSGTQGMANGANNASDTTNTTTSGESAQNTQAGDSSTVNTEGDADNTATGDSESSGGGNDAPAVQGPLQVGQTRRQLSTGIDPSANPQSQTGLPNLNTQIKPPDYSSEISAAQSQLSDAYRKVRDAFRNEEKFRETIERDETTGNNTGKKSTVLVQFYNDEGEPDGEPRQLTRREYWDVQLNQWREARQAYEKYYNDVRNAIAAYKAREANIQRINGVLRDNSTKSQVTRQQLESQINDISKGPSTATFTIPPALDFELFRRYPNQFIPSSEYKPVKTNLSEVYANAPQGKLRNFISDFDINALNNPDGVKFNTTITRTLPPSIRLEDNGTIVPVDADGNVEPRIVTSAERQAVENYQSANNPTLYSGTADLRRPLSADEREFVDTLNLDADSRTELERALNALPATREEIVAQLAALDEQERDLSAQVFLANTDTTGQGARSIARLNRQLRQNDINRAELQRQLAAIDAAPVQAEATVAAPPLVTIDEVSAAIEAEQTAVAGGNRREINRARRELNNTVNGYTAYQDWFGTLTLAERESLPAEYRFAGLRAEDRPIQTLDTDSVRTPVPVETGATQETSVYYDPRTGQLLYLVPFLGTALTARDLIQAYQDPTITQAQRNQLKGALALSATFDLFSAVPLARAAGGVGRAAGLGRVSAGTLRGAGGRIVNTASRGATGLGATGVGGITTGLARTAGQRLATAGRGLRTRVAGERVPTEGVYQTLDDLQPIFPTSVPNAGRRAVLARFLTRGRRGRTSVDNPLDDGITYTTNRQGEVVPRIAGLSDEASEFEHALGEYIALNPRSVGLVGDGTGKLQRVAFVELDNGLTVPIRITPAADAASKSVVPGYISGVSPTNNRFRQYLTRGSRLSDETIPKNLRQSDVRNIISGNSDDFRSIYSRPAGKTPKEVTPSRGEVGTLGDIQGGRPISTVIEPNTSRFQKARQALGEHRRALTNAGIAETAGLGVGAALLASDTDLIRVGAEFAAQNPQAASGIGLGALGLAVLLTGRGRRGLSSLTRGGIRQPLYTQSRTQGLLAGRFQPATPGSRINNDVDSIVRDVQPITSIRDQADDTIKLADEIADIEGGAPVRSTVSRQPTATPLPNTKLAQLDVTIGAAVNDILQRSTGPINRQFIGAAIDVAAETQGVTITPQLRGRYTTLIAERFNQRRQNIRNIDDSTFTPPPPPRQASSAPPAPSASRGTPPPAPGASGSGPGAGSTAPSSPTRITGSSGTGGANAVGPVKSVADLDSAVGGRAAQVLDGANFGNSVAANRRTLGDALDGVIAERGITASPAIRGRFITQLGDRLGVRVRTGDPRTSESRTAEPTLARGTTELFTAARDAIVPTPVPVRAPVGVPSRTNIGVDADVRTVSRQEIEDALNNRFQTNPSEVAALARQLETEDVRVRQPVPTEVITGEGVIVRPGEPPVRPGEGPRPDPPLRTNTGSSKGDDDDGVKVKLKKGETVKSTTHRQGVVEHNLDFDTGQVRSGRDLSERVPNDPTVKAADSLVVEETRKLTPQEKAELDRGLKLVREIDQGFVTARVTVERPQRGKKADTRIKFIQRNAAQQRPGGPGIAKVLRTASRIDHQFGNRKRRGKGRRKEKAGLL
jgi:hypothetical protein